MKFNKILTIQDISCYGQCSLTVALPVVSACGIETCVLPSAVLSTHTGGFTGFTFRDLTEDMPDIRKHWKKEGISFDAIYTGYLGSTKQIDYVDDIFSAYPDSVKLVDPAMADNGNLYYGFDMEFVERMKLLCGKADYLIPNVSEACFLTGVEYRLEYDESYVHELLEKLTALGAKNIILTGISYQPGTTGVVVFEGGNYQYYRHDKIASGCHGTGDIYASAFVGALGNGKTPYESAKIAADYVLECIKETQKDADHWYGARFEPVLYKLIEMVR